MLCIIPQWSVRTTLPSHPCTSGPRAERGCSCCFVACPWDDLFHGVKHSDVCRASLLRTSSSVSCWLLNGLVCIIGNIHSSTFKMSMNYSLIEKINSAKMILDASGWPCVQYSIAKSICFWFSFFVFRLTWFNSRAMPVHPRTRGFASAGSFTQTGLLTVDTYSLLNTSQQIQAKHKEKAFMQKSVPKSSSKRIAAARGRF